MIAITVLVLSKEITAVCENLGVQHIVIYSYIYCSKQYKDHLDFEDILSASFVLAICQLVSGVILITSRNSAF